MDYDYIGVLDRAVGLGRRKLETTTGLLMGRPFRTGCRNPGWASGTSCTNRSSNLGCVKIFFLNVFIQMIQTISLRN